MKKPLSFGTTMLASALGMLIVWVVGGILMFIMTIAMIVAIAGSDTSEVSEVRAGTVLDVDMSEIRGDRTASRFASLFSDGSSVGLVDAARAIREAATDDRVNALYLSNLSSVGVSWGSLKELRDAILDFQRSGKPVVAYDAAYTQGGYYLASTADVVALHPAGMVDFRGFGAEVMYYKELLDKLGVEMQLIRPESCAYKSAGEVYTLDHMSVANREQIRTYLSSNWQTVLDEIATSLNAKHDFGGVGIISTIDLNRWADNLEAYMADGAARHHLVDTLCFETDVKDMLKQNYSGKRLMRVSKYASTLGTSSTTVVRGDKIAVIYAEGEVVDGSGKGYERGVYGDDIVRALRSATSDDKVKAIVLRVNSPGGSATASEAMTHAVIQAREKKPVVVSMGDLAASAGYEMSCMAHVIVAEPTTITGSIGVFGTVPSVGKMLKNKLGLNVDTVSTNRNSTGLSVMRPLSAAARQLMERNVEEFYKTFVGRVAEGRNMTYDQVHAVARGRVWTGRDALRIGLVDTLGGLDVALDIASNLAGIEDYSVAQYPTEKEVWQQLYELMGEDDNSDISLMARAKLAWQLRFARKAMPRGLDRIEQDLTHISQAEGLQARMPFYVVAE